MKKGFVDIEPEMDLDDESIYSEDVREELLDSDGLSPMEAGFMQGYESA